jgi:hypothetical protein
MLYRVYRAPVWGSVNRRYRFIRCAQPYRRPAAVTSQSGTGGELSTASVALPPPTYSTPWLSIPVGKLAVFLSSLVPMALVILFGAVGIRKGRSAHEGSNFPARNWHNHLVCNYNYSLFTFLQFLLILKHLMTTSHLPDYSLILTSTSPPPGSPDSYTCTTKYLSITPCQ